jgi:hypothetical protein
MPGCAGSPAIQLFRIEGAFNCVAKAMRNFANVVLALEKDEDSARRRTGGDRVDTVPSERCLQRLLNPLTALQTVDPEASAAWDYCMDRQHCGRVHPACPVAGPAEA